MFALSNCTWSHVPPFRSRSPSSGCCSNAPMSTSVRIAIVGDVHDDWIAEEDTKALQLLKPDLVLFTGDFGNENVDVVQSISNLDFAKAAILGNHDAWKTQKFSPREKDAVQLQLEFLGKEHVGYRRMDFPNFKLSIVGGRPFSCGGDYMFRSKLLVARYGVRDMDDSAKKIYQAAVGTPTDHSVIFLAHNGPTGLGSNMDDICGRDWVPEGGDHGDPDAADIAVGVQARVATEYFFRSADLARAIAQLKETPNLSIKLVVFGHMHKELAYGNGLRKMIVVDDDSTVYLNGALVPRVKTICKDQDSHMSSPNSKTTSAMTSDFQGTLHAFTIVDIVDGNLEKICETWVLVNKDMVKIEHEVVLFYKAARM